MEDNMSREVAPILAADAFSICEAYASVLKMSLVQFCQEAGVAHSTVYRWRTKTKNEGYSVQVFVKLRNYYRQTRRGGK